MQNATIAANDRPARTSSGLAPLYATPGDLADFVRWVLSDPRVPPTALADSLDRRCTHHDGCDKVIRQTIAFRIVQALSIAAKRGQIDNGGKRNGVRLWRSLPNGRSAP
jgi:hypothetical protein